MEKDLNEVDNIALINIAKKLKIVNINLDQLIGNFEGEEVGKITREISIWRWEGFEPAIKRGNFAIAAFEKFVIEHPSTKFDPRIIERFENRKELYEFRKEILKDLFKEAYRRSFTVLWTE